MSFQTAARFIAAALILPLAMVSAAPAYALRPAEQVESNAGVEELGLALRSGNSAVRPAAAGTEEAPLAGARGLLERAASTGIDPDNRGVSNEEYLSRVRSALSAAEKVVGEAPDRERIQPLRPALRSVRQALGDVPKGRFPAFDSRSTLYKQAASRRARQRAHDTLKTLQKNVIELWKQWQQLFPRPVRARALPNPSRNGSGSSGFVSTTAGAEESGEQEAALREALAPYGSLYVSISLDKEANFEPKWIAVVTNRRDAWGGSAVVKLERRRGLLGSFREYRLTIEDVSAERPSWRTGDSFDPADRQRAWNIRDDTGVIPVLRTAFQDIWVRQLLNRLDQVSALQSEPAAGAEEGVTLVVFNPAAGAALFRFSMKPYVVAQTPTDAGYLVRLGVAPERIIGLLWGGLEEDEYLQVNSGITNFVSGDPTSAGWQSEVYNRMRWSLEEGRKLLPILDADDLGTALEGLGLEPTRIAALLQAKGDAERTLAQMK